LAAPQPEVTLTIFDKTRAIRDVRVRLQQECGMGTSRLVHWAGAQLQAPHRAVRELGFLPPGGGGVYISRWHHGSPAHRYGLYALHSVLEVNGRPTPDLDTFLAAVEVLKDGDFARVKVCHLETTQYKVRGSAAGAGRGRRARRPAAQRACARSRPLPCSLPRAPVPSFAPGMKPGAEPDPVPSPPPAHPEFKFQTTVQTRAAPAQVLSIRVDLTYFPTWELRLDLATATWQRRMISSTAP
jgi:hypothetical protein